MHVFASIFAEVVRTYEGQLYHERYGLETLPTEALPHQGLQAPLLGAASGRSVRVLWKAEASS